MTTSEFVRNLTPEKLEEVARFRLSCLQLQLILRGIDMSPQTGAGFLAGFSEGVLWAAQTFDKLLAEEESLQKGKQEN